ncbi:mucin-6-like isoform X2 [Haemaphysalis longicornis]
MQHLHFVAVLSFFCLALAFADDADGNYESGHQADEHPCGPNEKYKECQSSTCAELRCGERVDAVRPCTADCRNDCFCDRGFFRDPHGACVTEDKCPPLASGDRRADLEGGVPVFKFPPDPEECGANEEWKQCVSSTCAETSCKKRVIGPGCTYDCRYGCYCSEGFYRNAQGSCVTLDQCPPEEGGQPDDHPECGPNEEWKVCVSSSCAETTCEKRTIGPACTADCQRGCYCSSGFHRNAQGHCVSEDQCPSAPSK